MKREDIQFAITQLRQDKIIYATEATATDVLMVLCYVFVSNYTDGAIAFALHSLILLVGIGYTLFMGIGNYLRLRHIKALGQQL